MKTDDTEPKNLKALETGSGISWQEWLKIMNVHRHLNHTDMAARALGEIERVGKSKSPEWWAQGITVAYEQHIGRRKPGQSGKGTFNVTVTKTITGTIDDALATWQRHIEKNRSFDGVEIQGAARLSRTDKWRYWRCDLADGSKVNVDIHQADTIAKRARIAVNHDTLASSEDLETWRAFWKDTLASLEKME